MQKKDSIQMKGQTCGEKDAMNLTNVLTEVLQACKFWLVHQGAADLLFQDFRSGRNLANITSWFTLSSNHGDWYEGTTTTLNKMVDYLLRQYATNAVISKADENRQNFKEGSLASWDFSWKIWYPTVESGFIWNEQMLRRFL